MKKQLKDQQEGQKKVSLSKDTNQKHDEEEHSNLAYDSDEYCGMAIDIAMSSSKQESGIENDVILDTGSSVHVTNNIANLEDMGTEERWLLVGNTRIRMVGPGTMSFFRTEAVNIIVKEKGIRLKKVWFVEGMHTNLISMSLLQKNDIVYDSKTGVWTANARKRICAMSNGMEAFTI